MKKKLIWPGMLIALIAAIVTVDVTMLIISSTADIYTLVPIDDTADVASPAADESEEEHSP